MRHTYQGVTYTTNLRDHTPVHEMIDAVVAAEPWWRGPRVNARKAGGVLAKCAHYPSRNNPKARTPEEGAAWVESCCSSLERCLDAICARLIDVDVLEAERLAEDPRAARRYVYARRYRTCEAQLMTLDAALRRYAELSTRDEREGVAVTRARAVWVEDDESPNGGYVSAGGDDIGECVLTWARRALS